MEDPRQQAFQKLRPVCVQLSSVALQFRGQHTSLKSLFKALDALHIVLVELGRLDVLDEKLAEYSFFPLSNLFNESQRLSARCLELAVQCLHILVSRGWRAKLKPELGKQLLILLTLLAGGFPARSQDNPPAAELISACFECMSAIFTSLGQAKKQLFDETGAKTIVDQNVYLLLEAITDSSSDIVHLSAAQALRTLLSQISNRALLASILPRTVSALTQAVNLTTQRRRTGRVLVAILELLIWILKVVLADEVVLTAAASQSGTNNPSTEPVGTSNNSILDEKWLSASASQVKLALANVVKLRNHERQEVRHALLRLCLMVCEDCSKSLSESLQLTIETMVVIANYDDSSTSGEEGLVKHLILSNAEFVDSLSNSLNGWINALPRVLQAVDDRPKKRILGQISASVQILLDSDQAHDLLGASLATSLVEGVSVALALPNARSVQAISDGQSSQSLMSLQENAQTEGFNPVIMAHRSQSESLIALQGLLSRVRGSVIHELLAGSITAQFAQSSGTQQLSSLWLALNLLRQDDKPFLPLSEFIEIPVDLSHDIPYLISDLYSLTLPLVQDSLTLSASTDWRLSALALESIILQANQLGKSYRPELMDTLYPVLSLLGSSEPHLHSHAVTALNFLARACQYANTATMLVDNVDYLINSIALKLNSFDISPQGPQVLLMMLRLCGARLIPYLDDVIGSIFAALDNFHGYPRLVELLFEVLGVVVDEAAKNPILATTSGMQEPNHRKSAHQRPTLSDILEDVRGHKRRRERRKAENLTNQRGPHLPESAPQRPWTSKLDGPKVSEDLEAPDAEADGDEYQRMTNIAEEKEKPLPKPYHLLLSIARSTIPHLASPSARVRLTLLQLLTRITPILSKHENSFLPLVNDVWPVILPRLFSMESRGGAANPEQVAEQEDAVYVNVAAADTVAAICMGAGDFMSGRIESIFPRLAKAYQRNWAEVSNGQKRLAQEPKKLGSASRLAPLSGDNAAALHGSNLRGTVDLRIFDSSSTDTSTVITMSNPQIAATTSAAAAPPPPLRQIAIPTISTPSPPHLRTAASQIHASLTKLLTTIITHVRIPDLAGDTVLSLLGPIMDRPGWEYVGAALETWNADAVWVLRERMKIEREMVEGRREVGDWRWCGNREKPGAVVVEERVEGVTQPVEGGRVESISEFRDVVF